MEPARPHVNGKGPCACDGARWVTRISLVLLGLALVRAWLARWTCDGAFISFRYAQNLAEGAGLVWNRGERVEGITNLLWTLLLAPAAAVKADLSLVAQALGVLSLGALGMVLLRWSENGRTRTPVPLALWMAMLSPDLLTWATGGLETMTFAAVAAALALLLDPAREHSPRRQVAAGLLAALLFLLRPDGALIAGVFAVWASVRSWQRSGKRAAFAVVARVAVPLALTIVGATLFRRLYFGDFMPNTFHTKSAGSAYWYPGLRYVGLLLLREYGLAVALLIGVGVTAFTWRRGRLVEGAGAPAAAALVFALYVARSGGDFMFARRLVPVVPLALMAVERALIPRLPHTARTAVAITLVIGAALPTPIYRWWGDRGRIGFVADEPAFYPQATLDLRRAQAEALTRTFEGIDATFMMEGGLCMLAYYSQLPHIIDVNGLTDRRIGHMEVVARGRPGHEKQASDAYVEERRIHFLIRNTPPPGSPVPRAVAVAEGLVPLQWLLYDDAVMRPLAARPGVIFLPIEEHLRRERGAIAQDSCDEARTRLARLRRYYFRWNPEASGIEQEVAAETAARCR